MCYRDTWNGSLPGLLFVRMPDCPYRDKHTDAPFRIPVTVWRPCWTHFDEMLIQHSNINPLRYVANVSRCGATAA